MSTKEFQGNAPQRILGRPQITKETVKQYLAPDATDQELTLFVELCVARNLNPFIRDAYLVIYGKGDSRKCNIITGKDVFTKRAQKRSDFEGFRAGVILSRNGDILYQEGAFKLKDDVLLGGWAEVKKTGILHPFREEVTLEEYSSAQSTWKSMPLTMIRKVALVHALREAYPDEFGGLYDESELGAINGNTLNGSPVRPAIEMPTKLNSDDIDEKGATLDAPEEKKSGDTQLLQFICSRCDTEIKEEEKEYSAKFFGKTLCRPCQSVERGGNRHVR